MGRNILSIGLMAMMALVGCGQTPNSNGSQAAADLSTGIIGGQEVTETGGLIARSTVALLFEDAEGKTAICTGTLIDESVILTAAHCVEDVKRGMAVFALDVDSAFSQRHKLRALDNILVPSGRAANARATRNAQDIALVHFNGGIPAGYAPIPVLPARLKHLLRPGSLAIIAGYGNNNAAEKSGSGVLRATNVQVQATIETEVVLDISHGRGACNGDSGGPAFAFAEGRAFVWGVTSRGDLNCARGAIYTNATAYSDWIAEAVNRLKNGQ